MHGDSTNRWFDKSVTLVVFPDGQVQTHYYLIKHYIFKHVQIVMVLVH